MKILPYLLILASLLCVNSLKAQISYGGTPTSFGSAFKSSALAEEKLTEILIPRLDMAKVHEEDRKGGNRFAAATAVDVTPQNTGLWQNLPNGDRLWRVLLTVQTEEVTGMRLLFDKFNLPTGGKLFIYNQDHSMVLGSFTNENNHESGVFATTLVRGREVVMEYYEPASAKGKIILSLNRIDQAYKNPYIEKRGNQKKGGPNEFGTAGSCNININCSPLATDWQDEKRGVVRIFLVFAGGSSYCSGSLINNTALNNKPYLLTADHCGEGANATNLNQWGFDFNYEVAAGNCANPIEPALQSMTGATLRASSANSDFFLLELNQPVPLSYNAYFNGWDRTSTLPASTVSIHHPDADVKKFSRDTEASVSCNQSGTNNVNGAYLKVVWNNGITEGGSSGSPLFSPAGRIVGQLFGGTSFCDALSDPDWYGKVSVSWTGGGTPSTRLSDWLDPTNSGVTTLDGQNVGTPIIAKYTASTGSVTYLPTQITFTSTSNGATSWNWNFGTGASPATANTAGPHTVTYTTTGTRTVSLSINSNADAVSKPFTVLYSLPLDYLPANGGNFDTDNGHFMPITLSGTGFERGSSTVTGKNGTASGTSAYVTGLTAATYVAGSESYLYTPNYNFAAAGSYTLSFKTKFSTEADYDGFIVEYSTNKGTTWTQLGNAQATNWYNATVANDVGAGGFAAGTKFFSGAISTFETKTFDASTLAGNANVAFRFVFKSDNSVPDAGAVIDDFQIVGPFAATTLLPANNATAVALNQDLQITFTRNAVKGTGNIVIKKVSDNSTIETIAVTSTNVTVSGSTATINPTNDLPTGTEVYVEIASGAFKDANNVVFAGFTGSTNWKFTTLSDLIAPTLVSLNPANNATGVATTTNLVATFSENIKLGTGNITIKKVSDNSIVTSGLSGDAWVTVSGSTLTFNPIIDLESLTAYYVEISNGLIQDIANNNYVGFTGNTTWTFTTAVETTPPTVVSFNPAHNSINVATNANLVITFSENVKKGTGDIVIRKTSDNTAVETIAVTNAQVSITGAVVTIDANDFLPNTNYYVEIANGAIQDLANNNYAGITGSTTWAFTSLDNVAPTLTTLSPANNANNVNISTDLVMTFSENVKKGGAGSIRIRKTSDNSTVQTIDVTNTSVTVANNVVTINPANDLAYNTSFYVEIDNGFIQDLANNNYAGFTGNTSWTFTTANETTPPALLTLNPSNGASNVALATDFTMTFNENVKKATSGNILIKKTSDNTIAQTIAITDASVSITNATVTINPPADLASNTSYYIEVATGAIQDIAGNNFAGFTGNTTWAFSSLDTSAPTLTALSPAHNTASAPGANNLVMTFNENVKKGTGSITIKKVSDNSTFETIAITSTNVTIANNIVTINPTNDLTYNTTFYVEVTSGAIQDIAGNNYIGFNGNTTWKFTTDFSTALESNTLNNAITVYPNPTEIFATLKVTKALLSQEATLRLVDAAGKTVWTNQTAQLAETQQYDWKNIPAGKYFLEITTKQGKAVKAVIKQ